MSTIHLKTVSTIDAVREMLEQDIYSLYYPPGSKIKENDIAQRYGVSRNTLREAVAYLQTSGLLVKVPNKGIFVKEISVEDVNEIFHLRALLEGEAIREIMRNGAIPSVLWDQARKVQSIDIVVNWHENIKEDILFHEQLVHLAGNTRLVRLYESILSEVKLCIFQSYRFSMFRTENAEHHLQILSCMEKSDLEGALYMLNRHIDSAIHSYSSCFTAQKNAP